MISARLRELRIVANLTQKDIAISVNRTQQAVAKWEKGLAEPDASCIVTLANLFSVSTDYLLGCEKKPTVQAGGLSPKGIKNLLKELRKSHDYTQAYVAQYIGFSRSAYTNMELGTREMTVETLVKLAALYDVSTDYLLGCEKSPPSKPVSFPNPSVIYLIYFASLTLTVKRPCWTTPIC